MTALKATLIALFTGLLFSLTASPGAGDEKKDDKDKAKDATTLNDEEQKVTTTADGKEKTSKVELKYYLQVTGSFDKDGFHIDKIAEGSPVTQLVDNDGNGGVSMEVGDVIVEVDGKKVTTPEEYAKALNGVGNHEKVKLKIKDKNTGNDVEYYASARKR